MVWVDTRMIGQHGIGRYAREVCDRLDVPWRPLDLTGTPSRPLSALSRVPRGLLYSPGYYALVRAERQILTIHDLIQLQAPWPERAKFLAYYAAAVRPVVKKAGVVLTVSETSRHEIAEWIRDPSVEIVNAGIGVSAAFHPGVAPAPADDPSLMYVGNLRAHKNIAVVLDALPRVPGVHLRMLIPASEHDEARRLAHARGIADRVTLLSGLADDELASHYRGAHATVMPSRLEGFGLPPLESIMTGTPVIFWSGCAAVAETVADRGWAAERHDDPEEWAALIAEAIERPRRVVADPSRYDWSRTAAMVSETLRR